MWRNFSRGTSVSAINFNHENFLNLVTGYIGVLIFVFQPIANRKFTILIEYTCDIKFHHTIVAKVIRKLLIILLNKNKECSQVTLCRKVD